METSHSADYDSPRYSRSLTPPPTLSTLPTELTTQVVRFAVLPSDRRGSILNLLLVCRAFLGPARRELHRDVLVQDAVTAAGFLKALDADPSLATATRRLTLAYSSASSLDSMSEDAITPLPTRDQARQVLLKVAHAGLRELSIIADDDLETISHVVRGEGFESLQALSTNKIQWDQLSELVAFSPKLIALAVTNLYEEPEEKEDTSTSNDGNNSALRMIDLGDSSDDDDDDMIVLPRSAMNAFRSTATVPTAAAQASTSAGGAAGAPAPPPPPTVTAPSLPPPGAFSAPLRTLTLTSPTMSDSLLCGLTTSLKTTLTSFRLISATTISRAGLINALTPLPNLLELQISTCTFAPIRVTDPIPAGPWTREQLQSPLDEIATLCPWLQWLAIETEGMVSNNILRRLATLPLGCLTLSFSLPKLEVEDVRTALNDIPSGRLESVFIGKKMKWRAEQMEQARKACERVGTLFGGDAVEEPVSLW